MTPTSPCPCEDECDKYMPSAECSLLNSSYNYFLKSSSQGQGEVGVKSLLAYEQT